MIVVVIVDADLENIEKKTSTSTYKCTDYATENGNCKDARCAPGLWQLTSSDGSCTCKKYYSLEKGATASNDEYCKSNYLSPNGKCAEITSINADTCVITYNDGSDGTDTGNVLTTIGTTNYCNWKNGVKEVISDLVERYNKIKLDKILEKEDCDYEDYYCDKKYAELKKVYENYGPLLYHGIIKENGKKDKKCEYEFWRTVSVSSSYVNVYLLFAFTLLGLLF